jgi:hypothetical protein
VTSSIGGNPKVEQAFALGWHVTELVHMLPDAGNPKSPHYLLDQVGNLGVRERSQLLIALVESERQATGLHLPVIVTAPRPASPAGATNEGIGPALYLADGRLSPDWVTTLHAEQLAELMGGDYKLGKAYLLGVGLAETVILGYKIAAHKDPTKYPMADLRPLFEPARINPMIGQLRDLKSSFQAYAADASETTLREWAAWIEEQIPPDWTGAGVGSLTAEQLADRLYYQGQLWRSLMSGEKESQDALDISRYLEAVGDVAGKYLRLFAQWVCSPLGVVSVVLIFGLLGGLLYLSITGQLHDAVSSVVVVLGAVGVSTAGITAALKRAVNQAGQHMWQAELATAVTDAINKCPATPKASAIRKLKTGK